MCVCVCMYAGAGAGCKANDLDRWTKLVVIGVGKGDSGLSSRRAEVGESPVGCNPIKRMDSRQRVPVGRSGRRAMAGTRQTGGRRDER